MDALSDDDDEMEGDGPSSGAITAAQLADALAAASAPPVARITTEMLQQALSPASNTSRYLKVVFNVPKGVKRFVLKVCSTVEANERVGFK